jgi:glycosyltransferase involved in cell wall biosynthesis
MISQKRRDVKFVVAGEGSDEPDFRKTVCEYGLDGSLIALGLRDDLSAVFSVIDIFMYSSLSEGFPNVILEAMASRKPIVATDVGGTCEMLKNGYSGILVPPRSSQELAGATMALLDDGARARRLAEAARTAAKELFGIEEWLKQYEFVYENMYEKSKHNGGLS